MRNCFVVCHFSEPGTRARAWSDHLVTHVIKPAAEGLYEVARTIDVPTGGDIVTRIHRELRDADVVIADLSDANANVAYELGIRHALKRPYTLVCRRDTQPPFDLRNTSIVFIDGTYSAGTGYDVANREQAVFELRSQIVQPVTPASDRFLARAFDWTTTYAPHLDSDWLNQQDAATQKQLRRLDADDTLDERFRRRPALLTKFAEYRALKKAANQRYRGQLFYYVNPLDHSMVDGHAIYRFPTSTSSIDAAGREEGQGPLITFDQPPREVEEAGMRIALPGFVYSVKFSRRLGSDVLVGELNHPDTGTLLGRSELAPKWGLGL